MKAIYILLFMGLAFAQIDRFYVEVEPNPWQINLSLDLNIKAIDKNWNTVKDYEWEAFIYIYDSNWNDITEETKIVDIWWITDWVITFSANDKWEKKLSKSVRFFKEWKYKLVVEDTEDEKIKWEIEIEIWWWLDNVLKGTISIKNPIDWTSQSESSVDVIASTNMPNTQYKILLNWKEVTSWITDQNWDINDVVEWVNWENNLEIQLLDANNKVIWKNSVKFNISVEEDIYKELKIKPGMNVTVNEEVIFELETTKEAEEVVIKIWNIWEYNMTKKNSNLYEFKNIFSKEGIYDIDLKIKYNWKIKNYNKIKTISVNKWIIVKNVKFKFEPINNKINLNWEYEWSPSWFEILYWISKDKLDKSFTSQTNSATLDIMPWQVYYFQIYPLNSLNQKEGKPSDILEVWPFHPSWWPWSCIIKNIKINYRMLSWEVEIYRNLVPWATKYIISVSDTLTWEYKVLAEINNTSYKIPYDKTSKKPIYKYFKVEALCEDWSKVQVWDIKKIKVWPEKFFIAFLIITIIIYLYIRFLKN